MNNRIFLIRVSTDEAVNGREQRDYILESLSKCVLVMTEDATCEVMDLPPLGGVEVETKEQFPPAAGDSPTGLERAGKHTGRNAEEKREIMLRLAAYRKSHGLGCWGAVAKASKGKLSDDQLRDMAAGAVNLPVSEWRLAAKVLDKLEQQKKGESG